jgi:PAS domain S-box-containing protein
VRRRTSAFRESEERFRDLYENAPNAYFSVDVDGRIRMLNRRVEDLLEYTTEELMGRPVLDLYANTPSDKEKARKILQRFVSGEAVRGEELQMQRADGQPIWIGLTANPVRDRQGQVVGSRLMVVDITERKRAEKEKQALESKLRQSQKLESIGTLASGVAHEINNPLTGMINYADLIADRVEDDRLKGFAQGIIKEGNRVAEIVKGLLYFARQEKQSHSPARIEDIIDASLLLIGSVLKKDQITLYKDIPDDLPQVRCRSQQIEQVIINLLTNARDALNKRYEAYHEDKLIRIRVQPFEEDGIQWIRTTVEDHGTGIPEEAIDRIFDPFFTTKPRDAGTGLGLSVSYGIIKDHHGELRVESKPGEYTRFYLDLRVNNGWTLE